MKKTIILIIAVLLFQGCSSGFKKKKLVYRSSDVAYFKIKKKHVKQLKKLKEELQHPYEKDESARFGTVLTNIEYKKTSSIGSFQDVLFRKSESEEIGGHFSRAFSRLKNDEYLVAVKMSNETDSVLPSYTLTTMLAWIEKGNRLNIVFGDVDSYITADKAMNYNAWANPETITLSHKSDNSRILPGKDFRFKKVNGFDNNRWLVIDLDSVALNPAPPEKSDKTPPETKVVLKKQ